MAGCFDTGCSLPSRVVCNFSGHILVQIISCQFIYKFIMKSPSYFIIVDF